MDTELTTTADVMQALGGIPATAELTGADYRAAFNWKSGGKFPARLFLLMSQELERRGFTAPASLWGMVEADRMAS